MRHISDMLPMAVEKSEVLRVARAQAVMRRWPDVVGELLSEKSIPDKFERGTLWVAASGSAWAQEIRLQKEIILGRMNEFAQEDQLFLDLRVGVRKPRKDFSAT